MSTYTGLTNERSTTRSGVGVEKGIEPDTNGMRVKYRIESNRDETVAIRILEPLSESFPVDSLEFEDGLSTGDWIVDTDERELAFVEVLQPGDRVVTGYGVSCDRPDQVDSIIGDPTLDAVDPIESGTDGGPDRDPVDVFFERLEAGDIDDGRLERLGDALDSEPSVDQFVETITGGGLDEQRRDRVAEALDLDTTSEVSIEALIDAIEAGEIEEERLERLQEALLPDEVRSDGVRIRHLHSRLEDFAAYADALEEIIDEHGTAKEIIDQFRRDIDDLGTETEDLSSRLDEAAGDHESLRARLDHGDDRAASLDDRVGTLEGRADNTDDHLDRVGGRLDSLDDRLSGFETVTEDRLDRVEGRLDGVESETDRLEEELEERLAAFDAELEARIEQFEAQLDDRLETVDERLATLDEGIDQLEGRFTALADRIDDVSEDVARDIDRVDDELDELRTSLRETEEWRQQLGAAFQVDGGPADAD